MINIKWTVVILIILFWILSILPESELPPFLKPSTEVFVKHGKIINMRKSETLDDFISATYVINLKHQKEKLELTLREEEQLNLKNSNLYIYHPDVENNKFRSSWEAHRGVCIDALNKKYKYILVLEDDVTFSNNNWVKKVKSKLTSLEMEGFFRYMVGWDAAMIYPNIKLHQKDNMLHWKGEAVSIHSYIASVDRYCNYIATIPFDERFDLNTGTSCAEIYSNSSIESSFKNKQFFLHRLTYIIYHHALKFLFNVSYYYPPERLLDLYLTCRLAPVTYLNWPKVAIQRNMKSDQPSMNSTWIGFSERFLWVYSKFSHMIPLLAIYLVWTIVLLLSNLVFSIIQMLVMKLVRRSEKLSTDDN